MPAAFHSLVDQGEAPVQVHHGEMRDAVRQALVVALLERRARKHGVFGTVPENAQLPVDRL